MMIVATIQQPGFSEPASTSAIAATSGWIIDLLFGPLATVIAVLAIAWVGFAMLAGRVDIRRGLSVVLGCFLFFGAKVITDGLMLSAANDGAFAAAKAPPKPVSAQAPPLNGPPNGFDPYAGAAAPQR
jgi:type IV secretory pathway VirB2 component (pilin)